jgi:hypothetical protein
MKLKRNFESTFLCQYKRYVIFKLNFTKIVLFSILSCLHQPCIWNSFNYECAKFLKKSYDKTKLSCLFGDMFSMCEELAWPCLERESKHEVGWKIQRLQRKENFIITKATWMQKDKDKWPPNNILWKKKAHSLMKWSISPLRVSCTSKAIGIKWCPSWSLLYLQILTMVLSFAVAHVGQLMTLKAHISFIMSVITTLATKLGPHGSCRDQLVMK